MDSMGFDSRNITNNKFGDNATIYQGNIQNPAADQTDRCLKDPRPTDPRDDKTRIQQTKGGLLKESSDWISENETFKQWRDDEQNTLLWIKGDPGKGKTMLLCAIIDELTPGTKLAKPIDRTINTSLSYFFCQGTDSRINNATAVLRGLIYLIIIQELSLVSHVQEKYNHAGKDLFLDANAWAALSDILQNILRDPKIGDVVFIIDALDECETDSAKLLDLITRYTSLPHVKWIISSRNILSIQQRLELYTSQGILSLELKANSEAVSNAVDIYIEHRISRLHSIRRNEGQRDELRDALRQKANGTFLWVSLVVTELEDVQSWEVMEVVKEMPMDLAAVYRRMIGQIQNQRRGNANFCWRILSTIFTAYYPLSLDELGILSDLPKEISDHFESLIELVTLCGSFLTIRQGIIYFIHQSAKDFLCTEAFPLQSDAAQSHAHIFEQSITALSTLPQNIYGLADFGFRSKTASTPDPNPLAPMGYSCFCWTDHFCDAYGADPRAETGPALKEKLWSFLKDYLLRWLESIALLGRLPDALGSIQKILRELQFDKDSQLLKFLHSSEKFIMKNGSIIDRAPLQVYGSALVFSQASSEIKQHQWKERLPLIEGIQGILETDSTLQQTLEGHRFAVKAVCFSLDSKTIASCSIDEAIRVWDAATGATQHTLMTGGRSVFAISLSPDSKSLVLVLSDRHSIMASQIDLVTISLESKTPSTQLHDSTMQLNGSAAYGRSQVLKRRLAGKPLPVVATFSADGKTVATSEHHGPIELWNTAAYVVRTFQKMKESIAHISAIAFSPDSKTVASGHADGRVDLWDAETSACFQTFTTSRPWIYTIVFRLDGQKLAVGLFIPGEKMRVLDMATGREEGTHIRHDAHEICAIAFSPDGRMVASGSTDSTIRLWDADSGMWPWITQDAFTPSPFHMNTEMAFSPDGMRLASFDHEKMKIKLWDTSNATHQDTFEVSLTFFYPKNTGDRTITFSPNGGTLALEYDGIWLWDIATGQHIYRPNPRTSSCSPDSTAVAISPNGEGLSAFDVDEMQLLNMTTEKVQNTLSKEGQSVSASTSLPEGKRLTAAYGSEPIPVWDTATGAYSQKATCCSASPGRYTPIKFLPKEPFFRLSIRYIRSWFEQNTRVPKQDSLLAEGEWINKDGKHLLWLPREYRTKAVAAQDNIVAIGHDWGVTFIRFNCAENGQLS